MNYKYHHIGLITDSPQKNEEYNENMKFYASGYYESYYGIELLRFEKDSPLHPLIKTIPHIAFVVDDIEEAIRNKKIISEPNSPTDGVTVCFIEVNGAPVEFLMFDKPESEIWPNDKKLKIPINAEEVSVKFLELEYHHFGICTTIKKENEIYLKDYKFYCTDHESNPFGLQWMRYENDCKLPFSVKNISHVAFKVNNLEEAIKGKKIIIKPNSPSEGILVAFIEENGIPIEFLEYK